MSVRVRLAPSPTGFMHLGTLRVALYDYFFAKQNNGKFILRIEDTDQSREVEGAVSNILKTLRWAGLTPDEGPDKLGGEYGPYTQSERLDIYRTHVDALLASGAAYWCDCTQEALEESRKQHLGYPGFCRDKKLESGEVVRLKVPNSGETTFTDLIRGEISIPNKDIDDQVLMKSDGFPTYHLAVVVDDHLMEISHIFRGEEWIASTPKHVLLYEAFGFDVPKFAHLPLLLNADKSKLSKRQGDVAVEDYIAKGYLPEALLNFVALQGWNPKGDQELYDMDELVKLFDITKVNSSGSVVNFEKLDWMQSHYIKEKSDEELLKVARPFVKRDVDDAKLSRILDMLKDRLVRLAEIDELSDFIFEIPDYDADILVWKKSDVVTATSMLQELKDYFEDANCSDVEKLEEDLKNWITKNEYKNGDVLWPLRTALSGQKNSPPPFAIAHVLGKEEVLSRLTTAIKKLS
ncbi:MAG: glutamate--tRNA ligase [Parcubacteria group bacterium]|nr:glutamate--tRNA ligase [Parcubacteria group bacterium]